MARKIGKPHLRSRSNNESISSNKTWPKFPLQLLRLVRENPSMMQNMSIGGVSKSWRAISSRCNSSHSSIPQLRLSETNAEGKEKSSYKLIDSFNLTFRAPRMSNYFFWHRKGYRGWRDWKYIIGCSQDVLFITEGPDFSEIMMVDPTNSACYSLLPWDVKVPFKLAVLSLNFRERMDNKKDCAIMVVTGTTYPALAFYDFKGSPRADFKWDWVRQDFDLPDPNMAGSPNHRSYMQFTNAIGTNGKFYATTLQGTLVVVECADSNPRIIALCRNRAVPTVPSRNFREYLVDFGSGIIAMVLLISRRSGVGSVDDVEVFRLDEGDKLSWVKMEDLGDRTLFVGKYYCISVPATEFGFRRNCVYFNLNDNDVWSMYDVEKGCILVEYVFSD